MTKLTIVAALALAGTAHADGPPTDEARAHFERGKALYEAQDYRKAVDEYVAAYKLAPFPELVFDIGQAHRLAGNDAEALFAYEQYLQQEPNGELAPEARAHALELRNRGVAPSTAIAKVEPPPPPIEAPRRTFVLGFDATWLELGTAYQRTYSVSGAYAFRVRPWAVFTPRVQLGLTGGGDVSVTKPNSQLENRAMDALSGSVALEGQARLLAFPQPWLFVGGWLGLGVASCAKVEASVTSSTCSAGAEMSLALEVGVVIRDRYELALALHPISLQRAGGKMTGDVGEHPLAPFGISFAYHLR